MANHDAGYVKSSVRTLCILEHFSKEQRPQKLTEIGRALDISPSSAFALLRSMENQGYISYNRTSRTYMVTLKAALLGAWINDSMISDSTILRLMMSLQKKTTATVVLGTMSGLAVQYIHVQQSDRFPKRNLITAGSMRPLLRSAMGQAFLASLQDEEIPSIVRRLNAEETDPEFRVPLEMVMSKVQVCRKEGYSYSEGAATKGAGMVAVLLATPPHQPALSVGIGAPIYFLRARRVGIVSALRTLVEKRRRMMEGESA